MFVLEKRGQYSLVILIRKELEDFRFSKDWVWLWNDPVLCRSGNILLLEVVWRAGNQRSIVMLTRNFLSLCHFSLCCILKFRGVIPGTSVLESDSSTTFFLHKRKTVSLSSSKHSKSQVVEFCSTSLFYFFLRSCHSLISWNSKVRLEYLLLHKFGRLSWSLE